MSFKAALLNGDAERSTSLRVLKVGVVLLGGSCLMLLSAVAMSSFGPLSQKASAVESANDIATSLVSMKSSNPVLSMTMRNLPGSGPWKELALAGIKASGQCNAGVTRNAVKAVMATMDATELAPVKAAEDEVKKTAKEMMKVGQIPPTGFWDPFGYSTYASEGRLLFFREAEIKHGRVCMLASLGLLVGENFHPLFGGDKWDGPATQLFPFVKEVPLNDFWPLACIQTWMLINVLEVETSFPTLEGTAFNGLWFMDKYTGPDAFAAKTGRIPGDFGFDPLNLKPKSEEKFQNMQNFEISNGRLAMLAAVGIISQEVATGQKVFR